MPASLGPLRFEPYLRPMVWGGRALSERLGKTLPTAEPYGESWEVSDHAAHRSVVADGPWRGWTLRQLMAEHRAALLGPAADRFETFPWLIKFLDARDWLSVQVHPDAAAVKTLWPGEGSKSEAWYVIDAQPESRIFAGLKPGIGPVQLREAVGEGRVAECLHSFAPQPGDCLFLPAGTVHAVGGGVLMAEIQETSDATFRLFDWNRVDAQGKPRKLHIDETFASIHWDYGPVEPRRVSQAMSPGFHSLLKSESFELDYAEVSGFGDWGRLKAIVILDGHGRWHTLDDRGQRDVPQVIAPSQVWVLPASLTFNHLELTTPLRAVLAVLP